MSRAFIKEDSQPEEQPPKPLRSVLPEGSPNYVTPDGAKRMKAELEALIAQRRPDERIRELTRILESVVVLDPPTEDLDIVRFGATVSVRSNGETVRYRIVGVDETDVARGHISWVSPIAMALLSAEVGDTVRAKLPSGERELEILDVSY
ncbi:MAG TPA: GreA/GreB family elongation factor [Candidatus Polarisedimenticolaceae bacterium]|nr:GreA/GreB family elongation factor [Candidatus Polarisedimenticolaceae bacterium]